MELTGASDEVCLGSRISTHQLNTLAASPPTPTSWPRVRRVFVCPPYTVSWPALADVPLYVPAVVLCVTLVSASAYGRTLWPALVDALLYVAASALCVSPPPVPT